MKDFMKSFFKNYQTRSLDNEPHPFTLPNTTDFIPLVKELFKQMREETKIKFVLGKPQKESKYHK